MPSNLRLLPHRGLTALVVLAMAQASSGCLTDLSSQEDETLSDYESFIMNDKRVGVMELPGMVRVHTEIPGVGGGNCSGMTISDTAILTAAHCICTENYVGGNVCASTSTVYFRTSPLGQTPSPITGTAVFHPDYNPSWTGGQIEHDLAIITIPAGSKPSHVIPFRVVGYSPSTGTQAMVAGYGLTTPSCTGSFGTLNWDYGSVGSYEDGGNTVDFAEQEWCPGDSGGAGLVADGSLSPNNLFSVISSSHPFTGTNKATVTATHSSWIASHAPGLLGSAPVWQPYPSQLANDIGVGANGAVWITTNTASSSGDFTIKRWNNALSPPGWESMPGLAVRIAVDPNGDAWVVNHAGGIYRWRRDWGGWEQLPGLGTDVAIGANGAVWLIGAGPGADHGIFTWNRNGWTQVDGAGVRVAVDPSGNPWVLASDTSIWRRTGGISGYWQNIVGGGLDIGIGGDGRVWLLGYETVYGGHPIFSWTGSGWVRLYGTATAISAARGARPWVVNVFHQIFRGL